MVEQWMQGYLKAWASDDPDDIAALFTENARYYPEPYACPWTGQDRIVSEWIARGDSDADWTFEYSVLAHDGDLAVVRGITRYFAGGLITENTTYHNIWLIRFAPNGRASEFTEWWMEEQ